MHRQPQSGESTFKATDIVSAVLLAATGGLLDAVVYLDHGHVFANAMTGNVIFLGIAAIQHDWWQVLRHTVPLTAFLLGVVAARLICQARVRRPAMLVLALETATLLLVGLLPAGFPQLAFTGSIAFVSAFQVATFRQVGRFTYNSTFITGNLRMVAEGVFDRSFSATPAARERGRAQSIKLGAVCLAFLAGALLGAFAAPRFPAHAILLAEPFLLTVLIMTLRAPFPAGGS